MRDHRFRTGIELILEGQEGQRGPWSIISRKEEEFKRAKKNCHRRRRRSLNTATVYQMTKKNRESIGAGRDRTSFAGTG